MSLIVCRHVLVMASGCTLLLWVSLLKKQSYRTIFFDIQTHPFQGAGCSVLYFYEVSIVMFITRMKTHAVDTENEAA